MKDSILKSLTLAVLAASLALAPTVSVAQETSAPPPKNTKSTNRSTPFKGKVSAVDKTAMTFSVGERTFGITSETKITKDGKPATLQDAVVGEEVGGSARKSEDGKLVATSVRFGPKPETKSDSKSKSEKKKKEKEEAASATNAAPAQATPAQ